MVAKLNVSTHVLVGYCLTILLILDSFGRLANLETITIAFIKSSRIDIQLCLSHVFILISSQHCKIFVLEKGESQNCIERRYAMQLIHLALLTLFQFDLLFG